MRTRSPKSILALSGALALSAMVAVPVATMARGFGPGSGSCDGDCTNDGVQVQRARAQDETRAAAGQPIRARDGSAAGVAADDSATAGLGRGPAAGSAGKGVRANGNGVGTNGAGNGAGNGIGNNGAGNNGAGNGPNLDGDRGPGTCDECTAEMGTLTDEQVADLVFMANEEKMAHDVYAALADLHDLRIFSNIAASEARHFEAVNTVLERYGQDTFALDDDFTNPILESLYTELMEQAGDDQAAAMAVGLTIENTDIADLQSRMAELETSAPDAYQMYTHLLAGSENHRQAFERWS